MTTLRPPGTSTPDIAIFRYSVDFNSPKPRRIISTVINGKNTAGNYTDVHTETPTKITYDGATIPPKTYVHTSYIHTKLISKFKLISNIRWYAINAGDYYYPSPSAGRVFFNAIRATQYFTPWDKVDKYENLPLTDHPHKVGDVLGKIDDMFIPDWIGNPFIYTKASPYLISFGNTKETAYMVLQFTLMVRDITVLEDEITPKIPCVWIYDDVLEF